MSRFWRAAPEEADSSEDDEHDAIAGPPADDDGVD